ncbi:hypothetical protein WN944_003173 [Citrus x changshan-huyou]|uniref:Uncharacterized protein n=1 Tax=Citrus x changshan-huyou TaxID=2935761 RepID=A0AAP0QKW4_9ROSI
MNLEYFLQKNSHLETKVPGTIDSQEKASTVSLEDKLAGIFPARELFERNRASNLSRRPNSRGISPWIVLFSRAVTLLCLRPHVMPSHSQKWRESFHELRIP